MARPTKWHEDMAEQVYNYTLLGATDEQLADFLKVDVATIYRWAQSNEAFCEARKKGKELADLQVTKSLFRRANGYEQPSEKLFCYEGAVVRAETVTHVVPDTTAAIFWLKNRRPDLWRDKQVQEHELPEGTAFGVVNMRSSRPQPEEPDDVGR